jgi:AcrR family transcriptional regulator
MAHPKQLAPAGIVQTAVKLLEEEGPEGLSLRAVAKRLGVKAPSLYNYFADKSALERAVIAEGQRLLLEFVRGRARKPREPGLAIREMASAYVKFARLRPALYFFVMHHAVPDADATPAGKELWRLLLDRVGGITANGDDTSGAVAVWAFLHGFTVLEHSGRFGRSGPREGFERGLRALISGL